MTTDGATETAYGRAYKVAEKVAAECFALQHTGNVSACRRCVARALVRARRGVAERQAQATLETSVAALHIAGVLGGASDAVQALIAVYRARDDHTAIDVLQQKVAERDRTARQEFEKAFPTRADPSNRRGGSRSNA